VKRLFLLRHAKAVPAEAGGDDHARVLSPRGEADAARMGHAMAEKGYAPERVWCSPAARTRQTWTLVAEALVAEALAARPRVMFRDEIYLATQGALLTLVQKAPADVQTLLLVGHNPGFETLALTLSRDDGGKAERARRQALREKFPTTALAVLDLEIAQWADAAPGAGMLADLLTPKTLKA
jgi:phosphohistidine phosphatase